MVVVSRRGGALYPQRSQGGLSTWTQLNSVQATPRTHLSPSPLHEALVIWPIVMQLSALRTFNLNQNNSFPRSSPQYSTTTFHQVFYSLSAKRGNRGWLRWTLTRNDVKYKSLGQDSSFGDEEPISLWDVFVEIWSYAGFCFSRDLRKITRSHILWKVGTRKPLDPPCHVTSLYNMFTLWSSTTFP